MPTYEYECESGHRYEKREGFDAPSKQKCPTCKKLARRVIHAPPIVFKGSGFYATDSRGSSATAKSEDSSEGKSDSVDSAAKPAAKDDGHGHTHGPGGHTHDAPAPKKDAEATAAS
jgi:putative FmdB family regulatory protein